MEKHAKRFWRCFGPVLVLLELATYFFMRNDPVAREIAALLFFALNSIIVARLAYIKSLVDKHNARVAMDMAAKQAILSKGKLAMPTSAEPVKKKRAARRPETPSRVPEFIPAAALA